MKIVWTKISRTEWQAEVDNQYVGSIQKSGKTYHVFSRYGKIIKRAHTLAGAKRGVKAA